MGATASPTGRRIVAFSVRPVAYRMVADWIASNGHRLVLLVTTPGPSTRRSTMYQEMIAQVPPGVDVLVTTRLRRVATPLIRELQPDLIISGSFPYRITPEIVAISRFGAVNFHPAPLPAYRGPNPERMFYESSPVIGATLHRTEEEFDTGRILSQVTAPLTDTMTPEAMYAT